MKNCCLAHSSKCCRTDSNRTSLTSISLISLSRFGSKYDFPLKLFVFITIFLETFCHDLKLRCWQQVCSNIRTRDCCIWFHVGGSSLIFVLQYVNESQVNMCSLEVHIVLILAYAYVLLSSAMSNNPLSSLSYSTTYSLLHGTGMFFVLIITKTFLARLLLRYV